MGGLVKRRIHAAVQGSHAARAELGPEFIEGLSARVTQHQIESREATLGHVLDISLRAQSLQGHRCVKVIEDVHEGSKLEDQLGSSTSVGTVGGHNGSMGFAQGLADARFYFWPIVIENQFVARRFAKVAMRRIVGNILLKEGDTMAFARQSAAQPTP